MKKKLLILAGLFTFVLLGFSLRYFFPHYSTDKGKIVYIGLGERKIAEEADTETFKELDNVFGIDKNYVYYMGKALKNIDRNTFEPTDWFIPVPNDPVWGIGCQTSYITEFKDKNGVYKTEDLRNRKD